MDALTTCAGIEGTRGEKVRFLLEHVSATVWPGIDYHVLLLDELKRRPFPRLINRVTFGPTFDLIEPREDSHVQELLDLCGPLCSITVEQALRSLRVPRTYVYSEDAQTRWYTEIFKPMLLDTNQWADCMACYWAASSQRLVLVNAFRPVGSPAFTEEQQQLLSLATRAVAPVMDLDLFNAEANPVEHDEDVIATLKELPDDLRPLLLVLLQGQSLPAIARMSGLMTDEVEIATQSLLKQLGVRTRGELIATFVDRRVLRWLENEVL
jgi:hypothetical protein